MLPIIVPDAVAREVSLLQGNQTLLAQLHTPVERNTTETRGLFRQGRIAHAYPVDSRFFRGVSKICLYSQPTPIDVCFLGNYAISLCTLHGLIRLPYDPHRPRTVFPLPTAFPVRCAAQDLVVCTPEEERRVEGETGSFEVYLW